MSPRTAAALRTVVFFGLLLIVLAAAQYFLTPRSQDALSATAYKGTEPSYDVLFCGNSLMMNAVYPMELWQEEGIYGYNLGTGGQPLTMSYYLIRDGISRFHPKLIVLDTTQLIVSSANQKPSFLHYLTDNLPVSAGVRYEMFFDIADQMDYDLSQRAGFLLPFYAYHDRWKELTKADFTGDPKKHTSGAKIQSKVAEGAQIPEAFAPDPSYEPNAYALAYLDRIIALCKEENTELLLVSVPLCAPRDDSYRVRVNSAYAAERHAEEVNVPYYNLIDGGNEIGIDALHDTTDGYHLNVWGAEKYTAALGSYLKEHFDLPDRREDPSYTFLEKKYRQYLLRKYRNCLNGNISEEDRALLLKKAEADGVNPEQ